MKIGNRIRDLRVRRGITQEALAEVLGVTSQTVSKWECGINYPEVSVLPELSVFFGVSIDSLFSISGSDKIERIINRIEEGLLILDEEAKKMEETLLSVAAEEPDMKGKAYTVLASLHNHQALCHRKIAAEYGKTAIYTSPDSSDAISEYANAMGSYIPDWDVRNRHELISELIEFMIRNPDNTSACMWLMDNLINDGRISEAEKWLVHFKQIDGTFRSTLYKYYIAKARSDDTEAELALLSLENEYPDEPLVSFSLAEIYTMREEYEKALKLYERGEAKAESPRLTDYSMARAHICEIIGDTKGALDAYRNILKILKDDWGIITGSAVDEVTAAMKKLTEE